MPNTQQQIGNATLLQKHKVAFLAASHISTLSVLPTLEWAAQMARREDVAVVSGFSSRMEEEVLHMLLRGKCGIILMLGRQHYKVLPNVWQKPLADNRLLIRGCRLILRIQYLSTRVCLPRLPSSAYFRSFIVILVDSCLVRA